MKLPFYKYHGAGNDFIIIDGRKKEDHIKLNQEEIHRLCERRFGIGADGLMIIAPSEHSDFEMIYYNSDGNISSMCGNGGRCIVKLASELGLFEGSNCTFKAIDGLHRAKLLEYENVALEMRNVDEIISLNDAYVLDTGSPHYVKYLSSLSDIDVVSKGKEIRYSEPFRDDGINVNFIKSVDDRLIIRTYERGVEDETLACGTGITAAAIVHTYEHREDGYNEVVVQARGGTLKVAMHKSDSIFTDVWLTGPAQHVFSGEIDSKT